MRLFEEYFIRHKLNVPVVHHCKIGTLFFKSTDSNIWRNNWILFQISWIEDAFHPGKYLIQLHYPVHNGYEKNILFKSGPSKKINWHEYENFIFNWSKNITGMTVIVENEITLNAWEMFVFMYDSWFSKQSSHVKYDLFKSLDKEIAINTRYIYYQRVLNFMSQDILRVWKYDVLAIINRNYSNWLVDLL